jgi:hypothetical protein
LKSNWRAQDFPGKISLRTSWLFASEMNGTNTKSKITNKMMCLFILFMLHPSTPVITNHFSKFKGLCFGPDCLPAVIHKSLFHQCLYFKFWRVHDGFFYSALVRDFYQGLMVFRGKIRWNNDLYNNLFDKGFSIGCFSIFKTLNKRDVISRNFTIFTEAQHVDTSACSNRGKKVIKRGGR